MAHNLNAEQQTALRNLFYKNMAEALAEFGTVTLLDHTNGMIVQMEELDVIVKATVKKDLIDVDAILEKNAKTAADKEKTRKEAIAKKEKDLQKRKDAETKREALKKAELEKNVADIMGIITKNEVPEQEEVAE